MKIDPDEIRTRVAAVKVPCPRPLDDGAKRETTKDISFLKDTAPAVKFGSARSHRKVGLGVCRALL